MQKGRIGKCLSVIFKPDPCRPGDQLKLAEGQINALKKRPDKADDKCRNNRPQEQPEPATERVLKNAFIQQVIISFSFSF